MGVRERGREGDGRWWERGRREGRENRVRRERVWGEKVRGY